MKILWKRGAISPLFHNIFYLLLDFHVLAGTRFSLRDKRLFEISVVEITSQLYCNCWWLGGGKGLVVLQQGAGGGGEGGGGEWHVRNSSVLSCHSFSH